MHIIVPTFDGHIYIIEGALQCAERIDIGEHIYRFSFLFYFIDNASLLMLMLTPIFMLVYTTQLLIITSHLEKQKQRKRKKISVKF